MADYLIPVNQSIEIVREDPFLDLEHKLRTTGILQLAAGDKRYGIITTKDLWRGLVGAGLGYVAAAPAARALGAFFSLPLSTQKRLSTMGALAGSLWNTGVITSERESL